MKTVVSLLQMRHFSTVPRRLMAKRILLMAGISRSLQTTCPMCTKKCSFALFVSVIFLVCFVPFLRNKIFYPVWPNAWREIDTLDVIAIKVFTKSTLDLKGRMSDCSRGHTSPKLPNIKRYNVKFHTDVRVVNLKDETHRRFLPIVNEEEKTRLLEIFLIVSDALKNRNVEYFLVEGSLLGAYRHRGMIPWDDDIDIAVNVNLWEKVMDALGCFDGYILSATTYMHWKFYPNSTVPRLGYPFIDIFFYAENDDYVWAMTHYLTATVIFAKEDVFPLSTAEFEGFTVPVPKNIGKATKSVFNTDFCQSPSSNHKDSITYFSSQMSTIRCTHLLYLYHMYHVH